jgi:hypothetical protein
MRLSESKCLLAIMGEVPHVTYSSGCWASFSCWASWLDLTIRPGLQRSTFDVQQLAPLPYSVPTGWGLLLEILVGSVFAGVVYRIAWQDVTFPGHGPICSLEMCRTVAQPAICMSQSQWRWSGTAGFLCCAWLPAWSDDLRSWGCGGALFECTILAFAWSRCHLCVDIRQVWLEHRGGWWFVLSCSVTH